MEIKPLDMLFFDGTKITSYFIKNIQENKPNTNKFSHCGLVINRSIMSTLSVKDDDLYIWESTSSITETDEKLFDVEGKKPIHGVQIRKLKYVVEEYLKKGGKVALAKLINNPLVRRDKESDEEYNCRMKYIVKILDFLHIEYYHRPYELSPTHLLSYFPFCSCLSGSASHKKKYIVCSELITIILQHLDVMDKNIDPDRVMPMDFLNIRYLSIVSKKKIDGKEILTVPEYIIEL